MWRKIGERRKEIIVERFGSGKGVLIVVDTFCYISDHCRFMNSSVPTAATVSGLWIQIATESHYSALLRPTLILCCVPKTKRHKAQ